jgi:hypothetical protein
MLVPEEAPSAGLPLFYTPKRTIRILDFVDLSKIDPVYFEKPYYLQPGDGGERTYALLHRGTEREPDGKNELAALASPGLSPIGPAASAALG